MLYLQGKDMDGKVSGWAKSEKIRKEKPVELYFFRVTLKTYSLCSL